jgi:hypothetical protein
MKTNLIPSKRETEIKTSQEYEQSMKMWKSMMVEYTDARQRSII